MLTADIIKTALEILFAAALLVGVWHREKLIAFERKIADAFDLSRRMIGAIVRVSLKAMRITVKVAFFIKYILRDCEQYGLKKGYCIIGF